MINIANRVDNAEVLAFRDQAWRTYFTNPKYVALVEQKFGDQARRNLEEMTRIQLRREILEQPERTKLPSHGIIL